MDDKLFLIFSILLYGQTHVQTKDFVEVKRC